MDFLGPIFSISASECQILKGYTATSIFQTREVSAKGKRPLRESGGQPFSEIKENPSLKTLNLSPF